MNIEDLLSPSTASAISSDLQAAMQNNAIQYAQDQFLAAEIGQVYGGLHRLPEAQGERDFYWFQPNNVGNNPDQIGPSGPMAKYQYFPGNSSKLTAQAPPMQYANIYFYMRLPLPTVLPKRIADFRTFQIDVLAGWQALEFQSQLTFNKQTHNLAYQANFVKKIWRYFDYANTKWVDIPGIPFPDFRQAISLKAEFSLDQDSTTHEVLSINGTPYPVGVKQATVPATADKLTIAAQIDPRQGSFAALNILDTELRYV